MLPPQPMAGGAPQGMPPAPMSQGSQPPGTAPSPLPGQAPPVTPPMDPVQQYQMQLQAWKQQKQDLIDRAIKLLRQDKLRGFRIDVETDSTIQQDADEDKQARVQFIESTSVFIEKAMMAAQMYPQMIPMLGKMILFGVRGFRVGRDLESSIEEFIDQTEKDAKASAGQPKPPDPKVQAEQIKAQAEMQKAKSDAESSAEDNKREIESKHLEMQMNQQKMQMEMEKLKLDMQLKQQEFQMKMEEMKAKVQLSQQEMQGKMQMAHETHQMEISRAHEDHNMQLQQAQMGHQAAMEEGQAAHQQKLTQASMGGAGRTAGQGGPVQGSRRAADGNYYVEEPHAGGKYKKVRG